MWIYKIVGLCSSGSHFNTLDVVSPGEEALPLLAAVAALLQVEAVDVQPQPRELRLIGGRHVVPALDRFIAFRLILEVILVTLI